MHEPMRKIPVDVLETLEETAAGRVLEAWKRARLGPYLDHAWVWNQHEIELIGVIAEYAVHQKLGLPWVPARWGSVDIPPNIQVRGTVHAQGRLPIYTTDRPWPGIVWVLVYCEQDEHGMWATRLQGWAPDETVRRDEWRMSKLWDGWAVPRASLNRPGTLPPPALFEMPDPEVIAMRRRNA